MSKYTTEVRYICEEKAGLDESKGFTDVDTIINNSWNKIFTTNVTFFDPDYKPILCKKILKHYYLREICAETVGVWLLYLNMRLEEEMPYFNQLYRSALLTFNPLQNTNLTRSHERTEEKESEHSSETNRSSSGTASGSSTGSGSSTDSQTVSGSGSTTDASTQLYSDTPQGSVSGLDSGTYLTNATKNSGSSSNTSLNSTSATSSTSSTLTSSSTTSDTGTEGTDQTGTEDTTETYTETVLGNSGENFSEMLQKFRETMLNIDKMVIDSFSDLFFGLW